MYLILFKYILFMSTLGTGFCCNSGWKPFQNRCYKVVEILYDATQAARFCQLSEAQLAYVDNVDILRFFHSIPNYNETTEYWLNETSSLNPTYTTVVPPEEISNKPCPYAKLLNINTEYCQEKKFFICEIKNENLEEFCPPGFDYVGTDCYKVLNTAASYADSQTYCRIFLGELANIDSESKEWEVKSLVIGTNQTFLVGAVRDNTTDHFKWNNGNEFNPVMSNFLTDSNETCLGLRTKENEPSVVGWVQVNCNLLSFAICEGQKLPKRTTTEPSTTEVPLVCPHGNNWKSHESSGYCYWETTYETQRLNWYKAREFCQVFGGDLASYKNEAEQLLGLGGAYGHYRGLWIGLQRDEFDVFHWVDGTVLNYTNWNIDQPNLNSNSKFCVTHAPGNSKWELDYCGVRRWFICRAPKVRMTLIPDLPKDQKTYCNGTGVSIFRSWYLYEDHCYLVNERAAYSWDTAKIFCQDNGAHLASIHSFAETDFILSVSSLFPETDFWIGLNARGLHSSYEWSDNTPLDFIYWSDARENKTETVNSCVKFNKRDGSWDTDHCNLLQGVICKKGVNITYEFTTTEPTTVMPGNCESGWYNLGNKCYAVFGKQWTKRLNWNGAKEECEKIDASLVSIHNQLEQDFLTDVLLEASTNVWIGLQAKGGGTIFHWSDDSRMDYTNWNENEPDGSSDTSLYSFETSKPELCVEMEYNTKNIGKWNGYACSEKRGYICQKMKNPLLTDPYDDPFKCANMSGWYKLRSACYGIFENQKLTWLDAQAECKKYNANLATFSNSAVQVFLTRKTKSSAYFWIGAREKMQDKYAFITGQIMFYTNWMSGQPRPASSLFDNCVAITSKGSWIVKSCGEKHHYICKLGEVFEAETEITQENTCVNVTGDWADYGGPNCYLLMPFYRKSWSDAMHYCFKHGGYLASFHSRSDIEAVLKHIVSDTPASLHIGLGKRRDGSYSWVDNSPVDFTNWEEDRPEHNFLDCVEMSMRNGKWKEISCDESYRGFICSAPKLQIDSETIVNNTPLEKDVIQQKLTIGGIFGIIICIMVVVAIGGVCVYYLRPMKQVQPKLLESEVL